MTGFSMIFIPVTRIFVNAGRATWVSSYRFTKVGITKSVMQTSMTTEQRRIMTG